MAAVRTMTVTTLPIMTVGVVVPVAGRVGVVWARAWVGVGTPGVLVTVLVLVPVVRLISLEAAEETHPFWDRTIK